LVLMIHALLDTTRVVRTLELDGGSQEVCAEAVATHDRKSNQLSITLSAFLRATEHTHIGEVSAPSWLPSSQSVTEHVGAEEAHEMANEVFDSWCHKVAASHPEPS